MVVSVSRIVAQPDQRDELRQRCQAVANASVQEAGCLALRVFQNMQDVNDFTMIGEFEDLSAYEAHLAKRYLQDLLADIPSLTDGQLVNWVASETV